MTPRACVLLAVLLSGSAVLAWRADPPVTDLRSQAQKEFNAGNFKDAWGLYRKLALDPGDDRRLVAKDFKQVLQCLRVLGREAEVDALRDRVVVVHQNNWRLLQAAADSFHEGSQYGFVIGGQFVRGHHRGGGEYVSAWEPDRARALKLMQQALPLVDNEPEREAVAEFYLDLANTVMTYRSWGESWKLQSLTDLSKLPDYSATSDFGERTVGAPVDADGSPVFYRVPARYDAAKSDGERWRWALAQVGVPSQQPRIAPRWRWQTFSISSSVWRRWPSLDAS